MNEVFAAAAELQEYFDSLSWPNCIIGGIAVIRWGYERTTVDADFSLLTGFGDEPHYLHKISSRFRARSPNEIDFAMRLRVFRAFSSNGTAVDIGLAAFPLEQQIISRAMSYRFATGSVLRVCDLHDLIIMKAFAGRDQDWADLQYVVAKHRRSIDWSRIDGPLEELCNMAENFASVPRLDALRQRISELDRTE